jgi:hypothetical protein
MDGAKPHASHMRRSEIELHVVFLRTDFRRAVICHRDGKLVVFSAGVPCRNKRRQSYSGTKCATRQFHFILRAGSVK